MRSLNQIQEENSNLINKVVDKGSQKNLLTLDKVLLSIKGKHYGVDFCDQGPGYLRIYTKERCNDWISWNLAKETLEKQSEKTQRRLNRFLRGKIKNEPLYSFISEIQ